jgi:hypothetical protein
LANKEFQVRHGLVVGNNVLVANVTTNTVDVLGTITANVIQVGGSTIPSGAVSNLVYTTTNAAFDVANAAFGSANNVAPQVKPSFDTANAAFTHSNLTYNAVNSVFGVANAAFNSANNVAPQVAPSFNTANAAYTTGNASFTHSNATYTAVNSAFGVINSAYTSLNAAYTVVNSAYNVANNTPGAYNTANGAFDKANSANALAYNTGIGANGYAVTVGTSGNNYAGVMANSSNAYTISSTGSANNYAGAMANSSNAYTVTVGASGNNYAGAMANSANAYAVSVGISGNVYANTVGNAANNYAGAMANSVNAYVVYTEAAGNAWANTVGTAGNTYAASVGTSSNNYANSTFLKLTADDQTITGNVSITGNLKLLGGSTIISSNNLVVGDSLIYLAANNYSGTDFLDIGFIANYGNTTGANVHTGLVRDATDKQYYLFNAYDKEPANNTFVPGTNNMINAVLVADINTSNLTLGGANAITWINSAYGLVNAAFAVANAAYGNANSVATSANSYALTTATNIGASSNGWANTVGASANNYVGGMVNTSSSAANNYAGVMANSVNAYVSVSTGSANNYAGVMANAANSYAASLTPNLTPAFSAANQAGVIANAAFNKANTSTGGGATIGNTAPSSPANGALWWSNTYGRLLVYYNDGTSSQWVDATPSYDPTPIFNVSNAAFSVANAGFTVANADSTRLTAAFGKANTALQNTTGVFAGSLTTTGSITITNGGGTYQAGSIYADGNWGMLFRSATASPASANFAWHNSADTELMRIDPSGYLGIGTSSPSSYSSMAVTYANTNGVTGFCAVTGSAATVAIELRDGAATPNRWWLASGINSTTDGIFAIYDRRQSVARIAVDPSGNTGIGTTTPIAKLQVVGAAGNTAAYVAGAGGCNLFIDYYAGGANYYDANTHYFRSGGSIANWMTLTSGNLGIATTTPAFRLQIGTNTSISTATPETFSLGGTFSSSAGTNSKLRLWTDGTQVIGLGVSSSQLDYIATSTYDHVFYGNGAERVRIKYTGNVGIANSSPGYPLTVNGQGYFQVTNAGAFTSSGTHLTLENANTTAGQSVQGFTFGGVAKASIRADYVGNLILNANSTNYMFGNDLGTSTANFYQGASRFMQATGTAISVPGSLSVTGVATVPYLYMNRSTAASGISWYSTGFTAWSEYMAAAGAPGQGATATITAPSGNFVTSWALRSFIENASGYGWTWESGTATSTTPSVVAELSSNTGNFKTSGSVTSTSIIAPSATLTPDQPVNTNIVADTTNTVRIRAANYTGGQWDHRFVKPDMGGGIPMFIQQTTGTAGTWSNSIRIGTYSGQSDMLYVYGSIGTAGSINPASSNTYDLGSSTARWRNIYTGDLHLANEFGNWTIVEGEDELFLYNNKKDKVYKFNLTEVDKSEAPPKKG